MRLISTIAVTIVAMGLSGTVSDDAHAQPIPGVPERFGGSPAGLEGDPLALLRGAETIVLTAPGTNGQAPNELVEPVNVAEDGTPLANTEDGGRRQGDPNRNANPALRPGLEQAALPLPEADQPEPPEDFDAPLVDAVDTRQRPELEPLGIRVGTFIVNTDTEIGVEFTDNVFGTGTNEEPDTLRVVRPSAEIRSDWNNHSVGLRFSGEYGSYLESVSENPIETQLEGTGRLDITRDTSVGIRTSFGIEQETRGSVNVADDASSPTKSRTYAVEGEALHRVNRLSFALRGGIEREDFDDNTDALGAIINNDDRDSDESEAALRSTYALSPMLRVYGDAALRWRRFDETTDDDGFARDADRQTYIAGAVFQPTPLLRAEVEVGFVHQALDDARLEEINDLIVNASLRWSISPLTTLGADYVTELEDTTLADATAEYTRRVSASIEHEVLRHFVVRAEGSYELSDYRGITLEETTYAGGLTMEYWLSRSFALLARYQHETQIGEDDEPDEIENVVMIGVRLRH